MTKWKLYAANCGENAFYDFEYAKDAYFAIVRNSSNQVTLRREWNQGTDMEVLATFTDGQDIQDILACCNVLTSGWLLRESDRFKAASENILNADLGDVDVGD